MSEEEFAKLDLLQKWTHVSQTLDYITAMEKLYPYQKRTKDEQRNLRLDQYQRWSHIKGLYAVHRDEMINTLENERYAECKNILENVFTMELDDALRDVIDD